MGLNSKKIQEIYSSRIVNRYDSSMSHFFKNFKKKAFEDSSLKTGDQVLVFCCGTGLDFPHILNKVGPEGKIIGVDFSKEMLALAEKKILKYGWDNIELLQEDVTDFEGRIIQKVDAGVCTLGLSIIPDFKSAYRNLLSFVRPGGEIIIGDMQLASGWHARLNPFTIFLAKRYGGTLEGHGNSQEIIEMMGRDLVDLRKQELFFKAYYYCIGKIR